MVHPSGHLLQNLLRIKNVEEKKQQVILMFLYFLILKILLEYAIDSYENNSYNPYPPKPKLGGLSSLLRTSKIPQERY